jgi:hypothetical protein
MVKQKGLTNVLRLTFAVSFSLVPVNGLNGFTSLNIGTILAIMLRISTPHLKFYMAIVQGISASIQIRIVMFLTLRDGYKIAKLLMLCFISSCCVLSSVRKLKQTSIVLSVNLKWVIRFG